MTTIANAAFPVAIGLILLALIARAAQSLLDDDQTHRLAREYLEPLTTWCLIATFIYLGAHAAAGDIGVWTVVIAAAIGIAAIFCRDSASTDEDTDDEPYTPEPVAPAAAPPRTGGPLWYGRDY